MLQSKILSVLIKIGQDGQVFLLIDLTCLFPGKIKAISVFPRMQYDLLCISKFPHVFVTISDKNSGLLLFLFPDNLILFVGVQVERYADKQADK